MKQFTYEYYRYILEQLLKKYKFISFSEGKKLFLNGEINNFHLTMRHDIDMDLSAAVKLAKIESEIGIQSTYFIMVRCPIYNIFSQMDSEYIMQILSYGHHLGLHFDCAIYPDISINYIESFIDKECNILKLIFDQEIDTISFHRPGPIALNDVTLKKYLNTYEKVFLEYFSYFSDSRSKWAKGNPLDSIEFKEGKNLHLCLHPVWWNELENTPYSRLTGVVDRVNNRTETYLDTNCAVWKEGKNTKLN